MEIIKLKNILEAVLLGADRPLSVIQMEALFELDEERPTRDEIRQALHEMETDYETRCYELKQVASGFRLQVRQDYAIWVGRLWEERPARYTRALLETMALIAYRQPVTRGEIEEVRGVSVSSNIIKTLMERNWIKVLGHKDVPGRPSLYGTTKEFLDYFNLKSLDQLPTLAEIKDLDSIHPELALDEDLQENTEGNTGQTTGPSDDDDTNDIESLAEDSANDAEDEVSEMSAVAAEIDSDADDQDEIIQDAVGQEAVGQEAVDLEAVDQDAIDKDSDEDSSEEMLDSEKQIFNV